MQSFLIFNYTKQKKELYNGKEKQTALKKTYY